MQTLNLDEDIYFLLILGMIAVGAHAHTLFNQRIDGSNSSQRWKFLDNIPIQLVTKKSSFHYGFIIYLMLFELIYLVLASSSSLVLMMYQISGREELTGALSETVKPNGAVPILASTAIILLSQVRPFSSFELTLRTMTHRYARIPESMKAVKQNIMRSLQEQPLQYPFSHNRNAADTKDNNSEKNNASLLTRNVEKWIKDEFSEEDSASFIRSYWNTLCLNEYTLESIGSSLWDADESEEILRLFRSTEHEVAQLRNAVETAALKNGDVKEEDVAVSNTLHKSKDQQKDSAKLKNGEKANKIVTQTSVAQWKTQRKKCTELEERLALLLSLLIINQPDVQADDDNQLSNLIRTAQSQQKSDIANYTFNATLIGGLVTLSLFTGYFFVESDLKGKIREDPFTNKAPYGEYLEHQIKADSADAKVYPLSGMHLDERKLEAAEKSSFFLKNSANLNKAVNETILILLIFASSISIALASRAHHIRLREWNVTVSRKKVFYPVSKYYATCTYAMVCSSAVLFVYYFLTLALFEALRNNKDVLALDVIDPFLTFMPSLISTSLIAWVCAYFSLFASDVILSDKKRLLENSTENRISRTGTITTGNNENRHNAIRVDLSAETVSAVPFRQTIITSVFFGLICAVVAVTGKLYLNNLISLWDASSTLILNFIGFSILFVCFFRSVRVFGTQSQTTHDGKGESVDGTNKQKQPPNPLDVFLRKLKVFAITLATKKTGKKANQKESVPSS